MRKFFTDNIQTGALALSLIFAALLPGTAHAQLVNDITSTAQEIFGLVTNLVLFVAVVGAFVMFIFAALGRFKWVHFFSLVGGAVVFYGLKSIIEFFAFSSGGNVDSNIVSSLGAISQFIV